MKRNELIVGEELYYTTERDWATPEYAGAPRGERVKVLAKEPWEGVPHYSMRDTRPDEDRYRQCAKGGGVFVERYDFNGRAYRSVLPLAGLKGGYATIHAEITKWVKARDERQAIAEDARLFLRSRASVALASIGVKGERTYNGRNITVDLDTFEAMAAALADLGWRYDSE